MSNKGSYLINAQNRDMIVKELEMNLVQLLVDSEMIQVELKKLIELKKIFDRKYSVLAALMPFPEDNDLMPRLEQVVSMAENLISKLSMAKAKATDQPCQEANSVTAMRCSKQGGAGMTAAELDNEMAKKRKERRSNQEIKWLTEVQQKYSGEGIEQWKLEDALSKVEDALSKVDDALSKEDDALSKEEAFN
ncbi:uncharacterized protein [Drosophila kikkawai]|uniref:Uncharacterized protein n=1 Tax=Drosophila kikkawai TaxID=30033 RepID=A0A6P4JT76_DROKI|nr:uncharacterized protein LOC108085925 [Drosophila kikkawai]